MQFARNTGRLLAFVMESTKCPSAKAKGDVYCSCACHAAGWLRSDDSQTTVRLQSRYSSCYSCCTGPYFLGAYRRPPPAAWLRCLPARRTADMCCFLNFSCNSKRLDSQSASMSPMVQSRTKNRPSPEVLRARTGHAQQTGGRCGASYQCDKQAAVVV